MNKKTQYREFCNNKKDLPVFFYDWWLDAVCGEDNWNICLSGNGSDILAFMPYYTKKVLHFNIISMPMLTQFTGPWIIYPDDLKNTNRPEFDKRMMNDLISQLPDYHNFEQNFHYAVSNWLPFYWKGYKQTTRYTYIIPDITDTDEVFKNFSSSKRKNIRKAEKLVEIKFDLSAEDFYAHHKSSLAASGENISYSYELFKRIYDEVYSRNSGRTVFAKDKEGNIHSALFVVWSKFSAYDLISTIDPEHRSSESASLLVWEIIKYLNLKTKRFDFEGSMIEPVERSFRQFGTVQKAYFNISKRNSVSYGIFRKLREKFRRE